MNELAYHVLHEGRRMGPYDRRTIVGLRIKKTLNSAQQLEASDGARLTVGELIGRRPPAADFNAMASGGYTSARATFSASLIDSEPGPVEIPAFRGEVELRVHADVLRIAGTHRSGLGLKEGRVKLPLRDVAYVLAAGSRADLWLRTGATPAARMQRLALELFSAEAVRDLLRWLPDAKPWLAASIAPAAPGFAVTSSLPKRLLWASAIATALFAALGLLLVPGHF